MKHITEAKLAGNLLLDSLKKGDWGSTGAFDSFIEEGIAKARDYGQEWFKNSMAILARDCEVKGPQRSWLLEGALAVTKKTAHLAARVLHKEEVVTQNYSYPTELKVPTDAITYHDNTTILWEPDTSYHIVICLTYIVWKATTLTVEKEPVVKLEEKPSTLIEEEGTYAEKPRSKRRRRKKS